MAAAIKNVFSREGAQLDPSRQLSQGRLLVSVSQQQGHRLKVEVDEQRVAGLRGPVDRVRWGELEFALQMVRDALTRVGLAQAELLVTEALIVQSGPGWNPVMELRLLDADEVDLPRIEATALAVLQGVVHGVSGTDDAVAMLPQQDLIRVRDVAKEGLNRMGGAQTIAASRGVGRSAASGTAGRTVCSPAKSLKLQPRANGLEGETSGLRRR